MPIFHTIKDIYREMRAKRWLAVALTVEALGLVGAIGSIPTVGLLPLIWTLAVVGLLSTVGILIVTAHYVWEYNRRPLNNAQKAEIEGLLAPYLLSENAKILATRSELSDFVPESKLFWLLRYQTSVIELAWTADLTLRQPGDVLVAELHGSDSLTKKIAFTAVPPPIEAPTECLSTLGEEVPVQFSDWGTLFHEFGSPIVFFQSHEGTIRYLRANQKVLFDDRLAAPVPVPQTGATNLPELKRKNKPEAIRRGEYPYEWKWETEQ